jgi:hypothetical protein
VTCTPSSNVITPNADSTDICEYLSLAAGTTIANPTHTGSNPVNGQTLEFVLQSAAPQTLTFGTDYSTECGIAFPTGTTGDGATKNHLLFEYNTTSTKWCLLASTKGAPARITSLSSSTTYTCPGDTSDKCKMSMTGASGSVTFAAPTGSPQDGQFLRMDILCTNTQTFSFNSIFIPSPNIPLPGQCNGDTSKYVKMGFEYSSDLVKWQIVATN